MSELLNTYVHICMYTYMYIGEEKLMYVFVYHIHIHVPICSTPSFQRRTRHMLCKLRLLPGFLDKHQGLNCDMNFWHRNDKARHQLPADSCVYVHMPRNTGGIHLSHEDHLCHRKTGQEGWRLRDVEAKAVRHEALKMCLHVLGWDEERL